MSRFVVGITGSSGACYGVRLVELLARSGAEVHVIITDAGRTVLAQETGTVPGAAVCAETLWPDAALRRRIHEHAPDAGDSALASGSWPTDGMIVCPCSMNTLGAIASGLADNPLRRAAMVTMKERRPLVVVPRETPLTTITIENMLRLAQAGATVLPAMPGFYHRPKAVADLVDFVVARVLDVLGVEHDLPVRWTGGTTPSETRSC
ncbi:MAG: UbiX family flavin prenyltransferase [Planctomycetes bacterium]|nr:UbiX family flavin prenyltransferase [Planctomycetota bacterium]